MNRHSSGTPHTSHRADIPTKTPAEHDPSPQNTQHGPLFPLQQTSSLRWGLFGVVFCGISIATASTILPYFFPTHPPSSISTNDTTASGTLGHALSFFGSDGTAPNTEKLGGIAANNFLFHIPSCPDGKVWIGTKSSGIPRCGFVTTPLVMEMRLLSGSIRLNGTERKAPYSFSAQGTDRIETGKDRATLQFVADASLLRLDKQTSITLGYGANSDGQTVAQTVLERGVLWGRVLTGTGMNFGHGGFVAGVRGTGINLRTLSDNRIRVAVPHSQNQETQEIGTGVLTSAAVSLTCEQDNTIDDILFPILLGQERTFGLNGCQIESEEIHTLEELYKDRWIAENVIEDILYMNQRLQYEPNEKRKDFIHHERIISTPKNIPDQESLCGTTEYWEQFEDSLTTRVCNENILYAAFYSGAQNQGTLMRVSTPVKELNTPDQGVLSTTPIVLSYTGTTTLLDSGYLAKVQCTGKALPKYDPEKHYAFKDINFSDHSISTLTPVEPLVSNFVAELEHFQSPCPPWEQACSNSRLFVSSENTPLFDRVEIFTKDALKSCKQNTSTYASGVIGIGFRKQSTSSNIQSGSVIAYNTHAIKQQLNLSAQSQGIQITLKLSESKEITQGNTITFLEIRDAIGTRLYQIYWKSGQLSCDIRIAGEQITCQGMKIGTEWQFTLPREALDQAKNGTLYIGNSADGSTPVLTPIRSIWLKRL